MPTPSPPVILAVASFYKGGRFLEECARSGATVYLLTLEKLSHEPWPRQSIAEVFTVPDFANRKHLIYSVAYLLRSRPIDRIVALDDFDVEVAAHLREHFRTPGHGESKARFFRDKLAMRLKAKELGVRIPEFTGIVNHAEVHEFLATVPGPWLVKPRGEASAAGIRKCHTADEVWHRIDALGDEQSYHLIERMVPGDLYHVDSLSHRGEVVFTEVNAYWKPLLDVYQGGGVYATRTLDQTRPEVKQLEALNAKLLGGFGLGHGASHTEFMKAHADGEFYFIETSSRVGGAETATMVEHATGVNLWAEWARVELAQLGGDYAVPPRRNGYAGVVISLCRHDHPDTSGFTDPEIVFRLNLKHHIGFVVAAPTPERVESLLTAYIARIQRDFHHAMPGAESVAN